MLKAKGGKILPIELKTQIVWYFNIPFSILHYFFLAVQEKAAITDAMQEYITLTCVKFINRTTEQDYLDISVANQ